MQQEKYEIKMENRREGDIEKKRKEGEMKNRRSEGKMGNRNSCIAKTQDFKV